MIYGNNYMEPETGKVVLILGLLLFFIGFLLNEIVLNIIACTCQSLEQPEDIKLKFKDLASQVTPIVYSKGYNITACGFEKCHPFDSTKYKRIWDFIMHSEVINIEKLRCYHDVKLPSRKWLLEVMSPIYLLKFNLSICVNKFVELPLCFLPGWFLRSQLLEPMMLGSVGSVEAAYLALYRGWAINLSGGFHHASRSNGEGFCVIPDITFVTHFLRKIYGVRKILIIDLDAHQGNGHERDHMEDRYVNIIDAYNHSIYPGDVYAKQAITHDIRISHSTSDGRFLADVEKALKEAMESFDPDFVIYNAGTDCLENDPLGGVSISH